MVRLRLPDGMEGPTFDPTYLILFDASGAGQTYDQVVPMTAETLALGTGPHGFDLNMVSLIPALAFCLHLPRTLLDTLDRPAQPLFQGRHFQHPHHIVPFPARALRNAATVNAWRDEVTVVFAPNNLRDDAQQATGVLGAPLRSVLFSELSPEKLAELWRDIAGLYATVERRRLRPPDTFALGSRVARAGTVHLERQFVGDQTPMRRVGDRLGDSLHLHLLLATTAKLESEQVTPEEASARFRLEMEQLRPAVTVHAAVSCPGIAPALARSQAERREGGSEGLARDAVVERDVVSFLVEHRAAATTGMGMCLDPVPGEAFRLLDQIEKHCTERRPSGKVVVRLLAKLGRRLSEYLGSDAQLLLRRASSVTAFSDFPIGLAILPGDTAPICCARPLAYRPLTPLTRALQVECERLPVQYFKVGFDVLIAECLDANDPLRQVVSRGWKMVRETVEVLPNSKCHLVDVASIDELNAILGKHRYDVLVLSGHGFYNRRRNAAGLIVGGQQELGVTLERVPPLVVVSACHVAPRGVGAVTLSDILLTRGASAVLGTLIPVLAGRNALLMVRLFTYIQEAVANRSPLRSLDQVWRWVTASNAVHEVLSAGPKMARWVEERDVVTRFKLERSRGRLRPEHVYDDTLNVLREMADEDGAGKMFRATMDSQGYFPESLLYVLLGRPDRIILYDEIAERARAAGVALT